MTNFNKNIHGLRGVAVLLIFLWHSYGLILAGSENSPQNYAWLDKIFTSFNAGVDIFFMISGYLITASLIRHKNAGSFLMDRYIRIYPVLITVECLLFLAASFLHYKWTAEWTGREWGYYFITNILLLPGVFAIPRLLGTAWTLSYEFLFYFFAAMVYYFWSRKRGVSYFLLLFIMPSFLYFYPRMIGFLSGAVAYFLINQEGAAQNRTNNLLGIATFIIYLAIMTIFYNSHSHMISADTNKQVFHGAALDWLHLFSSASVWEHYTWLHYLAAIPGTLFFMQVARGARWFSMLLQTKALQYMGTISYSFYMWHWPIFAIIKIPLFKIILSKWHLSFFVAWPLFTGCSLCVIIIISSISYQILEKRTGIIMKGCFKNIKPAVA